MDAGQASPLNQPSAPSVGGLRDRDQRILSDRETRAHTMRDAETAANIRLLEKIGAEPDALQNVLDIIRTRQNAYIQECCYSEEPMLIHRAQGAVKALGHLHEDLAEALGPVHTRE